MKNYYRQSKLLTGLIIGLSGREGSSLSVDKEMTAWKMMTGAISKMRAWIEHGVRSGPHVHSCTHWLRPRTMTSTINPPFF